MEGQQLSHIIAPFTSFLPYRSISPLRCENYHGLAPKGERIISWLIFTTERRLNQRNLGNAPEICHFNAP